MKIVVTAEHIERGKACKCDECPVALALARAGVEAPRVDNLHIHGFYDGRPFSVATPQVVANFVEAFDETLRGNRPPKPFEFDIPIERSAAA